MAPHPLNHWLSLAVGAFDRHEESTALEHLLEAWRRTRAERLAVLIERLTTRLTRELPPLVVNTRGQMLERGGPLDVPRAMAHVVALAEQGQWELVSHLLQRPGMEKLPPNPVHTAPLLDMLRRPGALGLPGFRGLWDVFHATKDPRALTHLRAVRERLQPGSYQAQLLDRTLSSFPTGTPLSAEDAATCETLEHALSEREEVEALRAARYEPLLARVYTNPEDTSARMVLADQLLEQGAPRGELIALQCTPHADTQRIARLLEERGWRWASRLGPHADPYSARFERGFPAAVQLRPDWRKPLPPPAPEWATVREVDVAGASFPDLAAWLSFPELRTVTVLKRVEPGLAMSFGPQALGVRRLGLLGPVSRKAPLLFRELERLPSLSRLLIHDADPEDVQLCAASPMAPMLERFEARAVGRWTLVAAPAKHGPLRAALLSEDGAEPLAHVLRGAVGLGRGALQVRVRGRATPGGLRLLKAAASAYARVEWR